MSKFFPVLIILCGVAGTTLAADFPGYPSASLLHGEKGNRSGIYIDCKPYFETQTIECDFFQMRLSTGANAAEREDQLQEQMAQDSSISTAELMEGVQEFCKMYQENRTAVDEAFGNFETQASKEYGAAIASVMIDSCDIKTSPAAKELMLRITKLNIEREAAKCKVWPHTWNERFEYQTSQDGGYWVARDGPSGECGVILVSTLKQHADYPIFWNYESQKIITNKDGDGFLLSCAELDEERTLHTWRSVEHEVDCDVFEFGF